MSDSGGRRAGLWWADVALLTGLAIALGFAFVLDRLNLASQQRIILGVLLALVPALVWLSLFYRRDRAEPEPKHYVAAVAILAGVLASGLGEPLIQAFDLADWMPASVWTQILGGIVVVGMVRGAAIWAAIRFSVFTSSEFDHMVDGVIYGTAAGVGYGTVLNLLFVMESQGALLGPAMLRVAVVALAYAAFGGLLGHFAAAHRLGGRPAWWPALGVGVTAVLSGVFFWLRGGLTAGVAVGLAALGPWVSLILASVMAIVLAVWLLRVTAERGDELQSDGI